MGDVQHDDTPRRMALAPSANCSAIQIEQHKIMHTSLPVASAICKLTCVHARLTMIVVQLRRW